jgi:hypothetical protein
MADGCFRVFGLYSHLEKPQLNAFDEEFVG